MTEGLSLIFVFLPSDVCSCFVWLAGEAWLVLQEQLGPLLPLSVARHSNAGSVSRMQDWRVRGAPGERTGFLPFAKTRWHRYLVAWTDGSASS